YTFSDGIGIISVKLAEAVSKRLNLKNNRVPSAFQIRFAGYKGVVSIELGSNANSTSSSTESGEKTPNPEFMLKLRPSMKKFHSDHYKLEILEYAKPLKGYLN